MKASKTLFLDAPDTGRDGQPDGTKATDVPGRHESGSGSSGLAAIIDGTLQVSGDIQADRGCRCNTINTATGMTVSLPASRYK